LLYATAISQTDTVLVVPIDSVHIQLEQTQQVQQRIMYKLELLEGYFKKEDNFDEIEKPEQKK